MESKSHQVSNQDKDSQQEVERTFKDYIKPASLSKIMGNRKMIFGFYALAGYLGQFFLVVAAAMVATGSFVIQKIIEIEI